MFRYSKTETESITLGVDFRSRLENRWAAGGSYALTDVVRPTVPNGYEYVVTTAGQAAGVEPKWPVTVAATKVDGGITWTAQKASDAGIDPIASVAVTPQTGITAGNDDFSGTVVTCACSGGEAGTAYIVSFEVTTSGGSVYEEKVEVFVYGE